jgi:hypothetical protein
MECETAMEIAYLITALGMVFCCVFCYERGVKAGKAVREVRTTERVTEGGNVVAQETVTMAPEAAAEEPTQEEKDFDKAYRNWQGYEPKYPGVKE